MRNIMKLFEIFSISIVMICLCTINVCAEENFFGIYIGEDISNSDPVLCRNDIETALPEVIENALGEKEYRVRITFNEKGKRILEDVTSENIGECMAVVYNGAIICKPYISSVCANGEAVISGLASYEEAEHLALILRTGTEVRDKNSGGSNNAVSAYQGIFMNGDIFISLPLYTSYEPEDAVGIAYRVTKPYRDENGYVTSDILETLGEIYDTGIGYEIRDEGESYGLSYQLENIILEDHPIYNGTYTQVSNSGANMDPSDIWLNIAEGSVDIKGSKTLSAQNDDEDAAEASEYILPDSSSVAITEDQLAGLSAEDLRIARNEIYARHGRMFNSSELQQYFDAKSWYVPRYAPEEFEKIQYDILSDIEWENIKLILKMEEE